MIHYDDTNFPAPVGGIIPRRESLVYGGSEAASLGLEPVGDVVPDGLVSPSDYKDVIQHCTDNKIFAVYHQRNSWSPKGKKYNQNGLNYCWTWSATGDMMDLEAIEDRPLVLLAPVSMGWLVRWRNDGFFLSDTIKGLREKGVVPVSYVGDDVNSTNRDPSTYKPGWEDARQDHRLMSVFDTDGRRGDDTMIQHCLSILRCGRPLYVAYNWWSHAVSCVGMKWDESKYKKIVWIIRNSHNEDDVIEMSGTKGVPDEAYGFISSVPA